MAEAVVRRGDPDSLEQVLRSLEAYLARICGGIALDEGEDALQEVLIIVMREIPRLRDPRALRSWARRIAVRESVRLATRERGERVDLEVGQQPAVPDPTQSVDVRAVARDP